MPIASAMADETKPEPGAPPAEDAPKIGAKNVAVDPDLVKLGRKRTNFGILTAAGILFLAVFFLLKLTPDRRFAGNGDTPTPVALADVAAGKVDDESFVSLEAEPMMAHAIRTGVDKNSIGLRVVPLRGATQKVWVVQPGDGWEEPRTGPYVGRLRELAALPFADAIGAFLAKHPRPLFATASAVRTGFASSKVSTVGGEEVTLRDTDRVAFDVIEPDAATVVCTYNDRHKNLAACAKVLADAGITPTGAPRDHERERATFDVAGPGAVATTATKLEAAGLWATRVDPVVRHYETTWGALKTSSPAGFGAEGTVIADAQLDLIGLYVVRAIPSDAYALIVGEKPQDYWYVLPVSILVGLIALLFAWALVRAVKRDLLPART